MTNRKPVDAPKVPWGTPHPVASAESGGANSMTNPEFIIPKQAPQGEAPPDRTAKLEALQASLSGQPVKQSSPFAPKPVEKKAVEVEKFEMGDAPDWGSLVRFVQKHGDVIIQARHPQPRGECIDTIYRGVTVFPYETCQLRHKTLGWVTWQDAQYE